MLGCRLKTGSNRVLRGGSWRNNARNCRSAYRNWNHPENRNDNIGFRLASAQCIAGEHANDQITSSSALKADKNKGSQHASNEVTGGNHSENLLVNRFIKHYFLSFAKKYNG